MQIAFQPKAKCTESVISDIWEAGGIKMIENEGHYTRGEDNWLGKRDPQVGKNRWKLGSSMLCNTPTWVITEREKSEMVVDKDERQAWALDSNPV